MKNINLNLNNSILREIEIIFKIISQVQKNQSIDLNNNNSLTLFWLPLIIYLLF